MTSSPDSRTLGLIASSLVSAGSTTMSRSLLVKTQPYKASTSKTTLLITLGMMTGQPGMTEQFRKQSTGTIIPTQRVL